MRRMLAGVAVLTAYLIVAAGTFHFADVEVRPLFDGPHNNQFPYRWVDPPESEVPLNLPPESGAERIVLRAEGSVADDVRTLDLQAGIVFPPGAFEASGQDRVRVRLRPVDPDEFGPPPSGMEHQGNAYRIEATYLPSGREADLAAETCDLSKKTYLCPSVLLTAPFGGTDIGRWTGSAWEPLLDPVETGTDIYADTSELGVFVALAEEGRIAAAIASRDTVPRSGTPLRDIIAIVLGSAATIIASIIYRRRAQAERREEARRRAAGRKYKPPQKGSRLPARKK